MSNISTSSGLRLTELTSPVDDKGEPYSHSINTSRTNFRLRLFLFCLIEAAYIILAAICLAKPIPLNIALRLSDSEVKGGFTVVFIVWHSLAVLAGGHILADAFSREWSVQLANIVPGTTDRVSTVTSGMLDRISHIFTKHASGTFKLAFLASLALIALTKLAPGTISAATTLIPVSNTVDVARQVSQIINVDQLLTSSSRANLIVRLEKIELTPFGFKLPPNSLLSLPSPLHESNKILEYSTDIVKFHHDCRWEVPSIFSSTSIVPDMSLFISAAGQIWSTTLIVGGQANAGEPQNRQHDGVYWQYFFNQARALVHSLLLTLLSWWTQAPLLTCSLGEIPLIPTVALPLQHHSQLIWVIYLPSSWNKVLVSAQRQIYDLLALLLVFFYATYTPAYPVVVFVLQPIIPLMSYLLDNNLMAVSLPVQQTLSSRMHFRIHFLNSRYSR